MRFLDISSLKSTLDLMFFNIGQENALCARVGYDSVTGKEFLATMAPDFLLRT